MQILAEAEDRPSQSHVLAYCLTAAVKVNSHQVRRGRHR
jgi:hypothetical protein